MVIAEPSSSVHLRGPTMRHRPLFIIPRSMTRRSRAYIFEVPDDILITALSLWPAEDVAAFAVTCHFAFSLLEPALAQAVANLGFHELPSPRSALDSRTRRLRHLQRLAARRYQTCSAGACSSIFLRTHESTVLACGDEIATPTPVLGGPSASIAIREVAAGETHCLLLAADGAWSWGSENLFGQLGHGDTKPRATPRRIEALRPSNVGSLAQVACGRQHTLILGVSGAIYSCGRGSLGQLGLGGSDDALTPQRVELTAACCAMPRGVLLTAGLFHSMAIGEGGALYTWGSGTNGRLGHGDAVLQRRPRLVTALLEMQVVHASAGSGHSVAVSTCGALFTWGQGYNGRLGHGNQETKPQPAMVESLSHEIIVGAVAGSEFTICVTDKGAPCSPPRPPPNALRA